MHSKPLRNNKNCKTNKTACSWNILELSDFAGRPCIYGVLDSTPGPAICFGGEIRDLKHNTEFYSTKIHFVADFMDLFTICGRFDALRYSLWSI